MGKLKEWSDIFEVMLAGEFFAAELYENEKFENEASEISSDGMRTDKIRAAEQMERTEKAMTRHEKTVGVAEKEMLRLQIAGRRIFDDTPSMEAFEEVENVAGEYLWVSEAFGEDVRRVVHEDFFEKDRLYKKDSDAEGSEVYENVLYEEVWRTKDAVGAKKKSYVEKLLSVGFENSGTNAGNVKIEITNNNRVEKESDIESISDMLTQRLCEMMARGTDGLY